ncbi:uncharacterized protein LOC118762465 [Octopus sinensis]|uniref:Uncharacterized protein LOC118762465 n=1 Tax=Octopus sinensis TaxID=2607531 RepID=A0A7E6ENL3_9MOLL|nr:uncharacterized protein LOC118762465 [Octopus sinensis]
MIAVKRNMLVFIFISFRQIFIKSNNHSLTITYPKRFYFPRNTTSASIKNNESMWEEIEDFINTKECNKKWFCSLNDDIHGERACFCDRLCHVFSDCCEDVIKNDIADNVMNDINKPEAVKSWPKNIFECIPDPSKQRSYVYRIIACPYDYNNTVVKSFCEQPGTKTNTITVSPMIGEILGGYVIFSNVYCAICHNVQDIFSSTFLIKCKWTSHNMENQTQPDAHAVKFLTDSKLTEKLHKSMNCRVSSFNYLIKKSLRGCHDYIRTCPSHGSGDFRSFCLNNPLHPVRHKDSRVFKNIFCALCNNAMINNVSCFENIGYFGHHLVDFMDLNMGPSQICGTSEVFDQSTGACRETQTILKINCTLLKLQENEYADLNDSIYLKHLDKTINKSQFYMQQGGSFICLKHYFSFGNGSGINPKMASKITEAENYLSIIGFVFSIPTLFIAFSVYCYFNTLRNLPGKMAMNLMASLFLANLVFLLANIIKELPGHFLCRTFAIIAHYTYLVSFCWMNIMAFDSWRTFSRKQILSITDRSNRSFKFYMLYAWLSPVAIVAGAVVTQYFQSDSAFSPAYGDSLCWFNKRLSLLIFFGLPLIIILIMNTIFFTFTFRAIYSANKFTKRCLSKSDKNTFIVFFKLYFILGINWFVSILYTYTQIELLRYISVLLMSFQGFFVGCSYLFSKKVCRQFQNKVSFFTNTNSSESSCKHTAISYLGAIKSSKSF